MFEPLTPKIDMSKMPAPEKAPGYIEEIDLTFREGIVKKQIESIRTMVLEGNFDEALPLMEGQLPIVEEFEKKHQDTEDKIYRIFYEPMEEVLYNEVFKPEVEAKPLPSLSIEAYLLYASILSHFKRYDEALENFDKALKRNPVEHRATIQKLEIYKIQKNLDLLYEDTKKAFKFIFHPEDIARLHRNLGYYFIEKQKYPEALSCYAMSRSFENSKLAVQEMQYIMNVTKGNVKVPTLEEARILAAKGGYPLGIDEHILPLANENAKKHMEKGQTAKAKYFLEVIYSITHQESIKKIIDEIDEQTRKNKAKANG
jgi:tetratricopeptide (TPR) repeat protein